MDKTSDALVLIVDDNANNLKVLGAILGSRGFKIAPASNGQECLDFIEKQIPDLIFLDIMMPGINGFEVCEIIKSNERTSVIPIIFISALSNPQQIIKAFESGGSDYVVKPFSKEDVIARAKVHIAVKKERQQLLDRIQELEDKLDELKKT